MFLNIYLATTVASVAIVFIKASSTHQNLLNKGYVISNKKIDLFSTIAYLVAPGLNVYMAYQF